MHHDASADISDAIALDLKYPRIIEATGALLGRCFPANPVDPERRGSKGLCVQVSVYSSHLPCLFPQHGPGKKHERTIALEPWQRDLVERAPGALLRGLVRSDGCLFINRTGPYEYPSYSFSNRSKDIIDVFTSACELLGVCDYRVTLFRATALWSVRVNRRASVAKLLAHVPPKA